MLGLDNDLLEEDDAPEFIVDSLENILTKSLHFEPEK